jgi:hypothetical protein
MTPFFFGWDSFLSLDLNTLVKTWGLIGFVHDLRRLPQEQADRATPVKYLMGTEAYKSIKGSLQVVDC